MSSKHTNSTGLFSQILTTLDTLDKKVSGYIHDLSLPRPL